jgi:hypothetical protein
MKQPIKRHIGTTMMLLSMFAYGQQLDYTRFCTDGNLHCFNEPDTCVLIKCNDYGFACDFSTGCQLEEGMHSAGGVCAFCDPKGTWPSYGFPQIGDSACQCDLSSPYTVIEFVGECNSDVPTECHCDTTGDDGDTHTLYACAT